MVIFVLESKTVNKMKLVQAWIEIHNDELMADWELAMKGETILIMKKQHACCKEKPS
jgi:hypothetical protein